MIYPLFYARYRRFAWFLFFCGTLYGMAFFALITRRYFIEVQPFSHLLMHTPQSICSALIPLVGFDAILWLFGFTVACGFLSSLVMLGYGVTFGILASLTAPLYRQIAPWQCICVLLLFIILSTIVIWLLSQANHCAHTLRTMQNDTNVRRTVCGYTLNMLCVIPLQTLLILSLWLIISQ